MGRLQCIQARLGCDIGDLQSFLRRPKAVDSHGSTKLLIGNGVRRDCGQAEVEVRLIESLTFNAITLESCDDGFKSVLVRNSDEHERRGFAAPVKPGCHLVGGVVRLNNSLGKAEVLPDEEVVVIDLVHMYSPNWLL